MELTLSVFLSQAGDHPVLLGILALVIGVTTVSYTHLTLPTKLEV